MVAPVSNNANGSERKQWKRSERPLNKSRRPRANPEQETGTPKRLPKQQARRRRQRERRQLSTPPPSRKVEEQQQQEQEQEQVEDQEDQEDHENVPPNSILVRNLPAGITASAIEAMFTKQGMVASVQMQVKGNGCYVSYTPTDAPTDEAQRDPKPKSPRARSKCSSPSILREHRTPSPSPSPPRTPRSRAHTRTRLKLNGKATRVHMRLASGPPTEGPIEELRGFQSRRRSQHDLTTNTIPIATMPIATDAQLQSIAHKRRLDGARKEAAVTEMTRTVRERVTHVFAVYRDSQRAL